MSGTTHSTDQVVVRQSRTRTEPGRRGPSGRHPHPFPGPETGLGIYPRDGAPRTGAVTP